MALSTISGTTGITDATITSAKLADFAAAVDLNGVELILDADQDTSITADTDDRIDFKIAGVEHISISNSSGDTVIKPMVDAKDIVFQQYDGNKIFEINDGNFVAVSGAAAGPGEIRIYEDTDNGSHYTGFKAGNNTASVAYVLPTADGTDGFQLTTDGSGTLSWSSAGTTLANDGNNRVVTGTGSGLNGEANLTFDGSTLAVTGAITGSSDLTLQDDLILDSDAAVLSFGEDNEITITHVADTGLNIKHTATGDDKPIVLTLQTGETDIAANDVIGTINFQAPDEGTGTDAILVAAGISAISEGDFSSSANATKLSFKTAVSAAASETMSLTSNGDLFLAGGLIDLKNDGNAVSQIKFYCESSNAHAQTLIGAPHAQSATNTLTLPDGSDGVLVSTVSTATLTNKTLTTPVIAEIDSGSTITLDATTDIVLDADGGDIFFKDAGTTFGSATNTSGNLIIKSGTTTAATFSGANVTLAGTVASGAITSSGIIKTDDATDATSTTDGSLQTDGGLSVAKDTIIGNDLKLLSDSAVLVFGAGSDATLTHTNDTGLTLNSTNKLMFNDASQFIQGTSATVLSIGATDEIDLTATAVDLNGTLNVSGVATFQATPVFPDGSLAVADLDIDGATDIGAAIVDADLFIVDDGAGGTNRKTTASRIKTYIGGASTLNDLTDVSMDITNFTDGLLIQTNSDGSAPGTGTLNGANKNIGIGLDVFAALTSGDENVCIGPDTGKAITTASGCVFIGASAGDSVTDASNNIAIGADAGTGMTTGDANTLLGKSAGSNFDTETHNTAMGYNAFDAANTGAEFCTLMGSYAGSAITTADSVVAIGYQAALTLTTGGNSVYIGRQAGDAVTDQANNVVIGYEAGQWGNYANNVMLGWQAGGSSGNGNNCIYIGYQSYGAGNANEILMGDNPVSAGGNTFTFGKNGNRVYNDFSSNNSWTRSSDERMKKDITTENLGLSFIDRLRPVTYKWRKPSEYPTDFIYYNADDEYSKNTATTQYGIIAQEVKAAMDAESNTTFNGYTLSNDGTHSISETQFVFPLIKAVQELSAKNTALEARIKTLEDA